MSFQIDNVNKRKIITHTICIAILVLCGFIFLGNIIAPTINGDEFGYWSNGATFAGFDWHELSKQNGWFGFGYGILLQILLRLPFKASLIYNIAILLNVLFLVIIYEIAIKVFREITREYSYGIFEEYIIPLIATIGSSTLYYSHYTMCEVFLTLLYWIIIYTAIKIFENDTWPRVFFFAIVNGCIFIVHLRSIGIVTISVFFLFYLLKKRGKKFAFKTIISVLLILSFFFVSFFIKRIINGIWNAPNLISCGNNKITSSAGANGISSIYSSLIAAFSAEGFFNLLIAMCGRALYSIISSCGILVFCFPDITKCVKNLRKFFNFGKSEIVFIFGILCFLCMLVESSITNSWGFDGRYDYLVYGRYHEFTIGILILYSLRYLLEKEKKSLKNLLACVLFVFLLGSVVDYFQIYNGSEGNSFAHSIWLFFWTHLLIYKNNTLLQATKFVSIALIGFISLLEHQRKIKQLGNVGILMLLLLFSIYAQNYSFYEGCLKWASENKQEFLLFEEKYGGQDYLICYLESSSHLGAEPYQFLLKNNTVHVVYSVDDYLGVKSDKTVLLVDTNLNEDIYRKLESKLKNDREYGNIDVWY